MKETKVYVDRDLLSSFYTRSGTDLSKRKWVQAEIVFYNVNNIYLYDIKAHDRELVQKVCEKIKEQLGFIVDGQERIVCDGSATGDKTILAVLKQTQKEYEK